MQKLDLYFYGEIGWWQTSPEYVSEMLRAYPEASEIVLHINSPGGYVIDGYGIYNLLKTSGKKVVARIEGQCASIATLIALAADEIHMMPLSLWLVHEPSNYVGGTSEELLAAAAELDMMCAQLVAIYTAKTGKTEEEIRSLMKEDRWMSAEEALEMGFITSILSDSTTENAPAMAYKAVARAGKSRLNLPTNKAAMATETTPAPAAQPTPSNDERGLVSTLAALALALVGLAPKASAAPEVAPVVEEKKEDVEPAPAASAQEEQKPDPNAELLARIEALEAKNATTEAENTTLKADIEELNAFVPAAKRKGTAAQAVVKEENGAQNGVQKVAWAPKDGSIAAQAAKMAR